jgi:polygalacturonase
MATYYVKTTGDDAKDGLSEANAWLTPGKAMSEVAAGDTVIFLDGTYTVTAAVTMSTTGAIGNIITFQAQNSGQAIWDVNNAFGVYVLQGTNMDYYTFDGLVFEGNETDQTSRVVSLITSDYITFTDCEFKNTQGHCLYADTCDNLTVTDCEIHGEVQHDPPASPLTSEGIYGIQCTNVSVTGTEIYNVSHQGILIYGGSDWTIDDNYIHDTSSDGNDNHHCHEQPHRQHRVIQDQ